MKSLSRSILFLSLILVLLCACQAETPAPTTTVVPVTETAIVTSTMVQTMTKTAAPSATPEPTENPSPEYESWLQTTVEPGRYIFIGGVDEDSQNVYYLISEDTFEYTKLDISEDWAAVHPMGEHGSVLLFDMNVDEWMGFDEAPFAKAHYATFSDPNTIVELPDDYWYRAVSPDSRYLLITNKRNDPSFGISIIDVSTLEITRLVKVEESDTWLSHYHGTPAFSPDGKWIMYYNFPFQTESEQSGLYLLPASCINNPTSCEEQVLGPFWHDSMWTIQEEYGAAWSPDSSKIVTAGQFDHMGLLIFDIENQEFTEIDLGVSYTPTNFHWSENEQISFLPWAAPKGDKLIYTYELSTQTLSSTPIENIYELIFIRWLVVD